MAKEKIGFLKLSRKFFDHPFFKEKREYSKAEAWLDLIQICAYEDGNSIMWKGKLIVWGRGQVVASVRYLQQRWNWKSVDKVFSFLEVLRSQNMIKTDNEQGIGRITLCKYDDYNDSANAERTQIRTVGEQSPNELKEDKEYKERKNSDSADAPNKSFKLFSLEDFKSDITTHRAEFSSEILNAFYLHWSEKSASGKMKFQLERTWETKLRLAKWARNEKKFGNGKPSENSVKSAHGQSAGAIKLAQSLASDLGFGSGGTGDTER